MTYEMDVLQKEFDKLVNLSLKELKEPIDDEKKRKITERGLKSVMPQLIENTLKTLKKTAPRMLRERRSLSAKFTKRNMHRWSKGFDLLEKLIVICTEAGENYNNFYRPTAVETQDIVFDISVRLHARACHISSEILCLLKNGYADGGHARWRALHEVVATTLFIIKHQRPAAERFLAHEIVDSYKGMIQYNKYADRLNVVPFSKTETDKHRLHYDKVIAEYGPDFKGLYGWASASLNISSPRFANIEADVKLDHMRPHYKWASQNIHANVKGVKNKLGMCEAKEDVLLVGQSNSGMTDPAHATAISLSQITVGLLAAEPNLDSLVTMEAIMAIADEVGDAFLDVEQEQKP